MRAKLLRKFRKRYQVKVAGKGKAFRDREGNFYSYLIVDHQQKKLHYFKTSRGVTEFCALGVGGDSLLTWLRRLQEREQLKDYYAGTAQNKNL
jgi:hypothetical protein